MVRNCCIANCKSVWTTGSEITFHRFPKDEQRRKEWIESLPVDSKNKVTNNSTVCSKHFSHEEFCLYPTTGALKNILKKSAKPTIFENYDAILELEPQSTEQHNPLVTANLDCIYFEEEKENASRKDVGTQTYKNRFRTTKKAYIKQVYALKRLLKRRNAQIQKLHDIAKDASRNINSKQLLKQALQKFCMSGDKNLLLCHELRNRISQKKTYSDSVKEFALTMYDHCPRAYDFLRTKITLPNSASLRKWRTKFKHDEGVLEESFTDIEVIEEANDHTYAITSAPIYNENNAIIVSCAEYFTKEGRGEDIMKL